MCLRGKYPRPSALPWNLWGYRGNPWTYYTKTPFDFLFCVSRVAATEQICANRFTRKRKCVELTIATESGADATLRLNLLYDLRTRHGSPLQTIIPGDGRRRRHHRHPLLHSRYLARHPALQNHPRQSRPFLLASTTSTCRSSSNAKAPTDAVHVRRKLTRITNPNTSKTLRSMPIPLILPSCRTAPQETGNT